MKILLVEDDEMLSHLIKKGLDKKGYAVDTAFDGEEALLMLYDGTYDLMILDINLPFKNGYQVLEAVREHNKSLKILILSAKSEMEDIVKGLDEGANDYLAKPFDFPVLEARINALLRRQFVQLDNELTFFDIRLSLLKPEVYLKNNLVEFTNKEYSILRYLMLNQDRVVSSEELIEHIWHSDVDLFSNSLKYHLHSVRKKMREIGVCDTQIKTYRGMGYQLVHE